MRFRALSLRCQCGLAPSRIKQVGLTADHQFVLHWWCAGCKRKIYIVKDLADCWRECPTAGDPQETFDVSPDSMREPDAKFLHSLGVKFPDSE
jgi:hypothetical protein